MPSLFELQIHQDIIYTSNRRYSIHINPWYSTGAKSPPRERFCDYQIWGAISVSRGVICDHAYKNSVSPNKPQCERKAVKPARKSNRKATFHYKG